MYPHEDPTSQNIFVRLMRIIAEFVEKFPLYWIPVENAFILWHTVRLPETKLTTCSRRLENKDSTSYWEEVLNYAVSDYSFVVSTLGQHFSEKHVNSCKEHEKSCFLFKISISHMVKRGKKRQDYSKEKERMEKNSR